MKHSTTKAKQQEGRWVNRALLQLGKDDVNADNAIAWAAYHSAISQKQVIHLL